MVDFRVVSSSLSIDSSARDVIYLVRSSWDDWFSFQTLFTAIYLDEDGERHHIGGTKIGKFGLKPAKNDVVRKPGYRSPDLPNRFRRVGGEFFSLGQDPGYYEALSAFGDEFREEYLRSLRDLAYEPELLDQVEDEAVTRVSLTREVPYSTIRDQFARLARGGARLTPYNFTFRYKRTEGDPLLVDFGVDPNSILPTNIHVLIGRNGVGKSTFLDAFATAMVRGPKDEKKRSQISNVVQVSFSAFDAFEPIAVPVGRTKEIKYHFVGLRKATKKGESLEPKGPAALSSEMTNSAKVCLVGARRPRLLRALRLLESDPLFANAGLTDLFESDDDDYIIETLPGIFKLLSSGHKIVLLTITRLVETVAEKSLVLLDEPEAHLHPPLLSAFVRTLSDLLTNRNGMAIIATHSPVVLQEVPRRCAWKLQRFGNVMRAIRPEIETFGENVGTLTDEVFGLEVTATGFHRMLSEAVMSGKTYQGVLDSFDGQLGAEGRAVLRSLIRANEAATDVDR